MFMRITYEEKVFESNKPVKVNELLKNYITDTHMGCIVNNLVHELDYEIREYA